MVTTFKTAGTHKKWQWTNSAHIMYAWHALLLWHTYLPETRELCRAPNPRTRYSISNLYHPGMRGFERVATRGNKKCRLCPYLIHTFGPIPTPVPCKDGVCLGTEGCRKKFWMAFKALERFVCSIFKLWPLRLLSIRKDKL